MVVVRQRCGSGATLVTATTPLRSVKGLFGKPHAWLPDKQGFEDCEEVTPEERQGIAANESIDNDYGMQGMALEFLKAARKKAQLKFGDG